MDLEIVPLPDYLSVVVSGSFDRAQLVDAVSKLFAASADHTLHKIIIDIRNLQGEISLMARYDFGRTLSEFQREPVRIAVVASDAQVWPDRFGENVANNRGVRAKVTTSVSEALAWLSS